MGAIFSGLGKVGKTAGHVAADFQTIYAAIFTVIIVPILVTLLHETTATFGALKWSEIFIISIIISVILIYFEHKFLSKVLGTAGQFVGEHPYDFIPP